MLVQLASVQTNVGWADRYPVIMTGFVSYVLFCFSEKHDAHCVHVHKVRWAYVDNALACRKLWRCFSSSSIVSYEPNDIDSPVATSIEFLLKYPCGDKLKLLARTSSSSSDFGSRPVHTRKSELLGNGALMVPLPAFLPSLIIYVFRKRAFLRFSYLESIDWSISIDLIGVV